MFATIKCITILFTIFPMLYLPQYLIYATLISVTYLFYNWKVVSLNSLRPFCLSPYPPSTLATTCQAQEAAEYPKLTTVQVRYWTLSPGLKKEIVSQLHISTRLTWSSGPRKSWGGLVTELPCDRFQHGWWETSLFPFYGKEECVSLANLVPPKAKRGERYWKTHFWEL